MKTINIHPLWLLVIFAAGLFVYHVLSTQRQTTLVLTGIDSRVAQLEVLQLEIDTQNTKRQSRLIGIGRVLQFVGHACDLFAKLKFWR